jgi:hypothetical protein
MSIDVGIRICAMSGWSGRGEEIMSVYVARVKMYCVWDGILIG